MVTILSPVSNLAEACGDTSAYLNGLRIKRDNPENWAHRLGAIEPSLQSPLAQGEWMEWPDQGAALIQRATNELSTPVEPPRPKRQEPED